MIISSCKPESVLTLERGNYFYSMGNYAEASAEYKKVILRNSNIKSMNNSQIEILAHAYQQLALTQAQLGNQSKDKQERKIDYMKALENIKKAESLAIQGEKRNEYRKTRLGIEQNLNQ
tara:strand:- start:642 stop:998 length:357 start_codon:yes stop_codon:yes gene_type:complete